MTKRILTIDDSKTIRDMLMLTLADAGFEVLQAVDGQDGLDVLSKQPVDVVITDINMPRMDGYEVIRQMRSNSAHKTIPILVLTTESEADKKNLARRGWRDRLDGQAVRSGPVDRDDQQSCSLRLHDFREAMNMGSLDQLKQTFFDECSEALQQIENGLPDIRDGAGSEDTINAVFRSVHSVKGGAGIFGFEDLVKFAHVFETVLDEMRSGKLAATLEIVDSLLQANDVLTDLIAMSRSGDAIPPNYGSECRAALEQILRANSSGEQSEADDASSAPADFEGLDFIPVRVDELDAPEDVGEFEYSIIFRPKPELLKNANEPLYILRELRKLGTLDLVVETNRLPALAELEADRPYLGWIGTLRTAAKREQLDEVFEFVIGDCELEITGRPIAPQSNAADPGSEAEAALLPAVLPLPGEDPTLVPASQPPTESPAPQPAMSATGEHRDASAPAACSAGETRGCGGHDNAGRA